MVRLQLSDKQWARIAPLLASKRERGGRPPRDNRNFIEAVLWWRRTGVRWRELPDAFGSWKTVFNRFDRWSKVHLIVDALGLPLTFEITEGQRHDNQPAQDLVARAKSRCLIGDKAYDSKTLRNYAVVAIGCALLWLRI